MTLLHRCTRCQLEKPTDEMSKRSNRPNGLHGWCKACMNARKRAKNGSSEQRKKWGYKTRYGLTVEQVDAMKESQEGLCAICKCEMSRMVVDHDHATGKVRGLLCHACNVKLHALDKWPHRDAAFAYLGRSA